MTARAEPSRKDRTRQSQQLASQKKKRPLPKVAGRWWPVVIPIATLLSPHFPLNLPSDDESTSSTVAARMEVHQRNRHGLNLFSPPYLCGRCHKTMYPWCMHCEGCGFCLNILECPVRGRPHPNTDKWLFPKWCGELDVQEILTSTCFLIFFWPFPT